MGNRGALKAIRYPPYERSDSVLATPTVTSHFELRRMNITLFQSFAREPGMGQHLVAILA